MKALDINAYGVQEMNRQEMVEVNGGEEGGLLVIGIIVLVGLVATGCTYDNHTEYHYGSEQSTTNNNQGNGNGNGNGSGNGNGQGNNTGNKN